MGKGGGRGGAGATRAIDRGMTFRELVEGGELRALRVGWSVEREIAAWEDASAGRREASGVSWPERLGLRGEATVAAVAEAARRGRVVVLDDDPEVRCRVVVFGDHAVCMEFRKRQGVTWAKWLAPTRDVEEGVGIEGFLEAIGERHFSVARNPDEPLTSNVGREALLEAMRDVAAWVPFPPEGTDRLVLSGGSREEGWEAEYHFEGENRVEEVTGLAGEVMAALVGGFDPRGGGWIRVANWDNVASSWERRQARKAFAVEPAPGSATLRQAALAGGRDRRAAAAARLAARLEGWAPAVADRIKGSVP